MMGWYKGYFASAIPAVTLAQLCKSTPNLKRFDGLIPRVPMYSANQTSDPLNFNSGSLILYFDDSPIPVLIGLVSRTVLSIESNPIYYSPTSVFAKWIQAYL
ncbi:hypothetical protein DSO57_1003606 [Entomophthora muscae]|uniref:Uncharacterized protein n=1 Tax=Entomophthora muscae TaxID=34485 RepID=A0ACC2TVP6_9FUNG|nr:hypothetical protein DSO57_1003606 [Entomophthora muscae]